MATYTSNLSLKKPAGSDNMNVNDINSNMDTLDAAVASVYKFASESEVSTQAAFDALLTTKLNGMADLTTLCFTVSFGSAFGLYATGRHFIVIQRGISNIYAKAIITHSGYGFLYTAHKGSEGWTHQRYKPISGDTAVSVNGTGTISSIAAGAGATVDIDIAIPDGYKLLIPVGRYTSSGLIIASCYQTTGAATGYVKIRAFVYNRTNSTYTNETVTVSALFVPV